MKQKTIVIASVLKPIDDTRMFEKFGVGLSDSGKYNVVIIGYPSTVKPAYPNIEFLALKPFQRLSIQRVLAPLHVLAKLYKVKHDILIVNTHDLLIVALLNRILFGGKIIYDIRENYYRNILHTNAFPKWFRLILASFVRAKEKLAAPFFHWFLLAEKGYQNEFNFTEKKATIVENKLRLPVTSTRDQTPGKLRLLFSGTLADSTGIFQAIESTKKLHALEPAVSLEIIGYAAQRETYAKILREIAGHDFIQLTGGNVLVPHAEIMKAIGRADFGFIIYPSSPHTENSMPTKLYEYMANRLPILLQDHRPWVEYCRPFAAAIILADGITPASLLADMKKGIFYSNTANLEDVSWTSEEAKLLAALDNLN